MQRIDLIYVLDVLGYEGCVYCKVFFNCIYFERGFVQKCCEKCIFLMLFLVKLLKIIDKIQKW